MVNSRGTELDKVDLEHSPSFSALDTECGRGQVFEGGERSLASKWLSSTGAIYDTDGSNFR